MIWFRQIERAWDGVFADAEAVDPARVATVEAMILDYPRRVAWVLLITSIAGYGVGALQLRLLAQLPASDVVKICILGIVTGLVGALFTFLFLEWRLAPLLVRLGSVRAGRSPDRPAHAALAEGLRLVPDPHPDGAPAPRHHLLLARRAHPRGGGRTPRPLRGPLSRRRAHAARHRARGRLDLVELSRGPHAPRLLPGTCT